MCSSERELKSSPLERRELERAQAGLVLALDGIQKMSVHFAFEAHRLLLVNDLDLNRSFGLHMPTNWICPQQGGVACRTIQGS
jgi:hypothetical protein